MALHQVKHHPVIKIHFEELMDELSKHFYNYVREYRGCIIESKWHDSIPKITPFSLKGFFAPILWRDLDLMVPQKSISE